MSSPTLVIARNDIVRRLRDRTALLFGVVTPVVMAAIIGLAFGGGFSFHATVGVVDADSSEVAAGIRDGLVSNSSPDDPLAFVGVADVAEAQRRLTDGSLDAVIVLPAGFGGSLGGGEPVPLSVLVSSDKRIAGQVTRSVAESIGARISATLLSVSTAAAAGPVDATRLAALVTDAQQVEIPVVIDQQDSGTAYSPVAYFAASMAILFVFFTIGAGARSLLREEAEGTLVRLRAAPIRPQAVLGGKAVGVLIVGVLSLVTVWLVTTVAFRANWGSPAAVLALIVAVVVAITGISILVAGLSHTEAQANQITTLVTFTLALLGGNFLSPGALPGALAALSRLTPNGWALPAFVQVGAGGATVIDVLPAIGVLLLMGAVTATLGLVGLRRRLIP